MIRVDVSKIDPTFKQQWVNALRGTSYKQGVGTYFSSENATFCPLGVAWMVGSTRPLTELDVFKPVKQFLPIFGNNLTEQECRTIIEVIVELNDLQRCTFRETADWIEVNL